MSRGEEKSGRDAVLEKKINQKKVRKPLDKLHKVCYNKNVNKGMGSLGKATDYTRLRRLAEEAKWVQLPPSPPKKIFQTY